LLNRAPTLHRIGIQAFEPVLIEGNAIKLHPLVCAGFNADFDGDQMAVHLPLSWEAQVEAWTLLLSTNNIFSPAHGGPVIAPSQDIVLGVYYLTTGRPGVKGEGKAFASRHEVMMAYDLGTVDIHAPIKVKMGDPTRLVKNAPEHEGSPVGDKPLETTVGRVLFNDILPAGMPYYNYKLDKKKINALIADCHALVGTVATLRLLDDLKETGFKAATRAGISFSKGDLVRLPQKERILAEADKRVDLIDQNRGAGLITEGERYNSIVEVWTHAREEISEAVVAELKANKVNGISELNPIFIMVDSGARGSVEQVRQLAGMRGLMAKPNGRIIETPIKANFREGLQVLEYFSSTHGARKGLADTALKTADSGYLTRKLADVGQNVIVNQDDCGTANSIKKSSVYKGEKKVVPLWRQLRGRVLGETITDRRTGDVVAKAGDLLDERTAQAIDALGFETVEVRSVLTCEASHGVCAKCYGMDLSTGRLVEQGLAVGIVAAQSIGEPGTQLTMRTFHIGGVGVVAFEKPERAAANGGAVEFKNIKIGKNKRKEAVSLTKDGQIVVRGKDGQELEAHEVPPGAVLRVRDGEEVKPRAALCQWEAHTRPVIAQEDGEVHYEDIVEGETMKVEAEKEGGRPRRVIIEHKGSRHPQIIIKDPAGEILGMYSVPEKAYIEVEEGDKVWAGMALAKIPRGISGSQDITGGLPRVTEIFEARTPKNPAVIAEIDGVVSLGEKRRGKISIVIKGESGLEKEHLIPVGRHLRVHAGDFVRAGEALTEGPLVPHDILRISGTDQLYTYLLTEVQNVYRAQGVAIDDKHIEVIVAQMLRKVKIEDPGDTDYLPEITVDKFKVRESNNRAREAGGKPATYLPQLFGITKASLQSESFISAASFQETTKVLTEAAIAGKRDTLMGLKENVILGHMIPAGTGFRTYHEAKYLTHTTEGEKEPVLATPPAAPALLITTKEEGAA
ncbi:MAG: DNA-directed RNA polymerase subunit beta', partial [Planctomycetes bacterium]|nr:DNA-directed RNA polymerase subunit beta' [Planctomycetota bacterium]